MARSRAYAFYTAPDALYVGKSSVSLDIADVIKSGVWPAGSTRGFKFKLAVAGRPATFALAIDESKANRVTIFRLNSDSIQMQTIDLVKKNRGAALTAFFVCPRSGRHVRRLHYVEPVGWGSSKALGVRYWTQDEAPVDKVVRRAANICAALREAQSAAEVRKLRRSLADTHRRFLGYFEEVGEDVHSHYEGLWLKALRARRTTAAEVERRPAKRETAPRGDRQPKADGPLVTPDCVIERLDQTTLRGAIVDAVRSVEPACDMPAVLCVDLTQPAADVAALEDHPTLDVRLLRREGLVGGDAAAWRMQWISHPDLVAIGAFEPATKTVALHILRRSGWGEIRHVEQRLVLTGPKPPRNRWGIVDPMDERTREVLYLRHDRFASAQAQNLRYRRQILGGKASKPAV